MEGTMHSTQLFWEFKTVSNCSNLGKDLERSDITRVQLCLFVETYHPFPWRHLQHDLIPELELQRLMFLVGITLLSITCSLDVTFDLDDLLGCLMYDFWTCDKRYSYPVTFPTLPEVTARNER
ncbi:hypothetical protein Tco_1403822 [Tanacetum coccineum]